MPRGGYGLPEVSLICLLAGQWLATHMKYTQKLVWHHLLYQYLSKNGQFDSRICSFKAVRNIQKLRQKSCLLMVIVWWIKFASNLIKLTDQLRIHFINFIQLCSFQVAGPRIHHPKLTPFSRYFVSQSIAGTDVSIELRVYKDAMWYFGSARRVLNGRAWQAQVKPQGNFIADTLQRITSEIVW
jgi:hypothetical protein